MSLELIAIVIALIVGVGFYLSAHKQTEAKLLAEFATVKTALTTLSPILSLITAHGVSLNDIEALLTAHGLTLGVLEDKAKNVLTEMEKSKAVQEIEAAIAKAKALVTDTTPAVDPVAAAALPAASAVPAATIAP